MRKSLLLITAILLCVFTHATNLDTLELSRQISIADFAIKNTEQGDNVGEYSGELYTQLSETYTTAKATLETAESQSEINNQTSLLSNAILLYAASYVSDEDYGSLEVDDLTSEITIVTWLLNCSKIGTKAGQYSQESYYKLYDTKQEVKATLKSATDQSSIDEAYAELLAAEIVFKDAVLTEDDNSNIQTLETTALSQAIDQASLLLESTTYGTEIGQYSAQEYMNLTNENEAAKDVLAQAKDQKDIDDAEQTLTTAINTYLGTKITEENYEKPQSQFQIGQLSSKIELGNYYLNNTTYGNAEGQYPIAKYRNLLAETEKAKDLLTTAESQAEIDKETTTLGNVIDDYAASVLTETSPLPYEDTLNITVMVNNKEYGKTYGSGSYPKNERIQLIAVPANGYHFVAWDDESTENPRTITVAKDAIYMATFEEDTTPITDSTLYSVLAISENDQLGIVLGSSNNIAYGTKITLIAHSAYDGYSFAGWSDGNTSNPRQLTVTENVVLVALFRNDGSTTTIDTIENDVTINIVNGQIIVNNTTPTIVIDRQGRKIANKNLKSGIYFFTYEGKSLSVFLK